MRIEPRETKRGRWVLAGAKREAGIETQDDRVVQRDGMPALHHPQPPAEAARHRMTTPGIEHVTVPDEPDIGMRQRCRMASREFDQRLVDAADLGIEREQRLYRRRAPAGRLPRRRLEHLFGRAAFADGGRSEVRQKVAERLRPLPRSIESDGEPRHVAITRR
jgi:hypothetical protein